MLRQMMEMEQLAELGSEATPGAICAVVAQLFKVRATEVALLKLSGNLLNFIHPAELQKAGAIPLASSSVAARTARTRQAELFNSFVKIDHFSVFELVKLGNSGGDEQVIQKLMSVPLLAPNGEMVVGVMQVSRKASCLSVAGPDFTADDLRKLEKVGHIVGQLMAEKAGATFSV
jgi:hypothetical protein